MLTIRIYIGIKLENTLLNTDMQLLEFQSWGRGGAVEELGEIHEYVVAFYLSVKMEMLKGHWYNRMVDNDRYFIFNSFKFLVICSSIGIFDKPDEVGERIGFQTFNVNK